MEQFGAYTVHERLGVGGMATVHRAQITLPDRTVREVALKRILPHLEEDVRFIESFVREATLASQLDHPRIVHVFDHGRIGNTYYLALELVHGDPLVSLMRRTRQLHTVVPAGVVIGMMVELCDALDYVHHDTDERGEERRIIHRDLTPANLVVEDDGHLKVIDFGVAKATRGKFSTNSGQAKGKLGYMPFEALAGSPLDARADIFSIGVVMWELLCGRRLFKSPNEWELMELIREGRVPAPSTVSADCPSELDEVVLRAVAQDRVERWPSAAALRVELEHVRRHYRAASTPAAVLAWKDHLLAQIVPHIPTRLESPEISISTGDLEPIDDEVSELSQDDLSDAPILQRVATPPPGDDGPTRTFDKAPIAATSAPLYLDDSEGDDH